MSSKDEKVSLVFRETRLRSLVKAIIYRVISLSGTIGISWLVTRDLKETLALTIAIQLFLIVLYYVSERVWNRVGWGRRIAGS